METEVNKKANKIPVIIGIVVLLVIAILIGVGYFLREKTPNQVFESALTELANKMKETVDKSKFPEVDLKENDISLSGKIKMDTDYDLNGLEALMDFTYGIQVDASLSKKILKVNLSMLEENNEIIAAKTFVQDNNGYIDVPGVLPYIMDLGDMNFDFDELDEVKIDKEEYKKVIDETKNMLIKTLDKSKFSLNKDIQKDYNGKNAKTTEYVYLLDEENQKRTWNELKASILANEEYMEALSNISGIEVETIKEALEENDIEDTEDISIVITTTGALNTPIAVEVILGEDEIRYVDYNDKISVKIADAYFEYQKQDGKEIVSFNYEDHIGKITLEETKNSKKEYGTRMRLEYNYKKNNVNLDIDTLLNVDANVSKENVQNAKVGDDFTVEEQGEVIQNFLDKIDGTSLEPLINSLLAGLV